MAIQVQLSVFSTLYFRRIIFRLCRNILSSCYLSLSVSLCMFVCICLRVCFLTFSLMESEPSQWKWQVEDIVFARCLGYSIFHALVGVWLVHRSTYQGTSIDQVENLNEALFIFYLFFFLVWNRPWELLPEPVGPNNKHEVKLQYGEDKRLSVEFILSGFLCRKSYKFVSLGPWHLFLVQHMKCEFFSCHVL